MALRVVGAGLGRTGTHSLKLALERLLGGPCYHMLEVFGHPEHIPWWQQAVDGNPPDWDALLTGYRATVDWPAAAFWSEISATSPDAMVLLSVRDTDEWWDSVRNTIFDISRRPLPDDPVGGPQLRMAIDMLTNCFTPDWREEGPAKAAYERHNDEVRANAPADRFVEWHTGDGWEPLCAALGVPIPAEPFPHVNTTADFRTMAGLDEGRRDT